MSHTHDPASPILPASGPPGSDAYPDCPIGGRDGSGPVCPHAEACDRQCAELVAVHDVRCGLRRDLMEAAEDGALAISILLLPLTPEAEAMCWAGDRSYEVHVEPQPAPRPALVATEHEVCQTLGAALGYPHDPEGSGICVGDHVAGSLAMEAAGRIRRLSAALDAEGYEAMGPGPRRCLIPDCSHPAPGSPTGLCVPHNREARRHGLVKQGQQEQAGAEVVAKGAAICQGYRA